MGAQMSTAVAPDADTIMPRPAAEVPAPAVAARYYPRVAEKENEHVIARTWQLAGHEAFGAAESLDRPEAGEHLGRSGAAHAGRPDADVHLLTGGTA